MSDYNIRPGGSLKLKGGVAEGGVIKKKKKKSKSSSSSKSESDRAREKQRMEDALARDSSDVVGSSSGGGDRDSPTTTSRKTDAERRFEEVQRERLAKRVAKLANKTHKDRVAEFNNHLETLSEHHDIPKVGPG